MKKCSACGESFSATSEYFENRRDSKDGLRGTCRKCNAVRQRQYFLDNKVAILARQKAWCEDNLEHVTEWKKQHYQENKERINEQGKAYRENNKDLIRAQKKGYRETHKEHISAHDKVYRCANKERVAEISKIYYLNNKATLLEKRKLYYDKTKDHHNEVCKRYYLAHKEKTAIYQKQYRLDNKWRVDKDVLRARGRQWGRDHKEAINVKSQRRRTMRKQLPSTLTIQQWEQIKTDFDQSCAYCGETKKLTIEHFVPLSKFGELTTNNVLPVCQFCNGSRSNHNFSEWFRKQPFYSPEREQKILSYLGYKNGIQQLSLL